MQRFASAEEYAPNLGAAYYQAFAPYVAGWEWRFRWRDMEDGTGLAKLGAALDLCQAQGKQLIARLLLKSYHGATPPADDAHRIVPLRTLSDAAYGGAVLPTFSGGQRQGWTVNMLNAACMADIAALCARIGAAYGQHPAFMGLMTDEIFWGQWNGTKWLSGDADAWLAASLVYMHHVAAGVGKAKARYVINWADGSSQARVRKLFDAARQMGAAADISDVLLAAEGQPVYPLHPAPGQQTIAHFDYFSTPTDPALAAQYVARAKSLGASIISMVTRGQVTGLYWQAHLAAPLA